MASQRLTQLTPQIHYLPPSAATDRPVLGAICGQRGTLLVDAGNSPAHARLLLAELARCGLPNPLAVALTHWHWDHVFGLDALDAPAFAYVDTKNKLVELAALDWSDAALDQRVADGTEIEFCRDMIKAELPHRHDLKLRVPDISFTQRVEIDLGGVTGLIEHVGGEHAPDSCVVYVPEERVLFMGDCLYMDIFHGERSYTTISLEPLITKLRQFEADIYLPAHGDPIPRAEFLGWAEELTVIGGLVDTHRYDTARITRTLTQSYSHLVNDETADLIQAFQAGWRKQGE